MLEWRHCFDCSLASSPPPTLAAQPPARRRSAADAAWNLTGDFAAPESAFYDAASNAVFVSSINGQILEKDGNGYISSLTAAGPS